jgi:hypothetical protein
MALWRYGVVVLQRCGVVAEAKPTLLFVGAADDHAPSNNL